MEKSDFFISYTKADRDWAEWIAWQLEDAGYKCLIQDWDFTPGSSWVQKMNQGTYAQRTLLVYSPDYFDATYVIPEWEAAFARDPTGEKGKILGVKVRECRVDGLLRPVVWISLIGLEEQVAKAALLKAAKGDRLKPLIAPSFPSAAQHSSHQEPFFPGATSSTVNTSALNQTPFLGSDPALILAANQRIVKAFEQRPSQLPGRAWMQVVWTPVQSSKEVLDPNQFINPLFTKNVFQLARQGEPALFDDMSEVAKKSEISNLTLIQHQGKGREENETHLVLYSNGTVSVAFTNLHHGETLSFFSGLYIDKNVVEMRLREALTFVARWYDHQDPHFNYDPMIYNLYFYNLDLHRWEVTPSSQVYSFELPLQGGPKSLAIYDPPKELARRELQNPDNLINHAITRAGLVFSQR